MNIKQIVLLTIAFLYLNQSVTLAQSKAEGMYPEIGKPCPDFILKDIKYYKKIKQASLKDFNNQCLILDFFATGCSACFASFSKVNHLQQQFAGKVQIILIGYDDEYVRPTYEKFKKKENLQLAVNYDTTLFQDFVPHGVPHLVWINENGIVKAITTSSDLNAENLQAFIDGKKFAFFDKSQKAYDALKKYDKNKPLLINGNGGDDSDFLYRSLLANWKPGIPNRVPESISRHINTYKRFEVSGVSVGKLYQFAYTGYSNYWFDDPVYLEYYHFPVLDIADSSIFKYNYISEKNLYCYSFIAPPEKITKEYVQKIMQNDLKGYFGYDASIETRIMPCWKLVATKEAADKLKSKGGKPMYQSNQSGFSMTNTLTHNLLSMIWGKHQSEPPFIDETGISGTIDISINALLDDLESVKKELQKNGLDLVKGERETKVLVIRDPKKE